MVTPTLQNGLFQMKINNTTSNRPVIEPMLSLINVVFLLLIFFLVVGSISPDEQIDLQLLHTNNQLDELDIPSDDWLYVTQLGDCIYHNQTLTFSQFGAHFQSSQTVYIAVDASLTMGLLNGVITQLKQLNIKDIALVTHLDEKASQ